MRTQVFVGKSKAGGLLVAAAVCVSGELNEHPKRMRGLLLAGWRRIHFKKESDPRRRKVLAAIADKNLTVRLGIDTTLKNLVDRSDSDVRSVAVPPSWAWLQ